MSNVIRFLETVGSKPLSAAEYAAGVALLDIDPMQRQALMDRNEEGLNGLLGGRDLMQCMIMVPDEG
jgi:hypothetical protein